MNGISKKKAREKNEKKEEIDKKLKDEKFFKDLEKKAKGGEEQDGSDEETGRSRKGKKPPIRMDNSSDVSSVAESFNSDSDAIDPKVYEDEVRWEDRQRNKTKRDILRELKHEEKV